jgi:predicted patatin/cPLA2 family phospholipase
LVDAQVYESIPYRTAISDNCTDILVLRTRADDARITKKMSIVEQLIINRYFKRKLFLPDLAGYMLEQVI